MVPQNARHWQSKIQPIISGHLNLLQTVNGWEQPQFRPVLESFRRFKSGSVPIKYGRFTGGGFTHLCVHSMYS